MRVRKLTFLVNQGKFLSGGGHVSAPMDGPIGMASIANYHSRLTDRRIGAG
jgi:hypothetical protein